MTVEARKRKIQEDHQEEQQVRKRKERDLSTESKGKVESEKQLVLQTKKSPYELHSKEGRKEQKNINSQMVKKTTDEVQKKERKMMCVKKEMNERESGGKRGDTGKAGEEIGHRAEQNIMNSGVDFGTEVKEESHYEYVWPQLVPRKENVTNTFQESQTH